MKWECFYYKSIYRFSLFVFSLFLFISFSFGSFASTPSQNWSTAEIGTYYLLNGINIVGDGYSFIIGRDDFDEVATDFMDFVSQEYLAENQTFDEWVLDHTSWYYDDSGIENEEHLTGFSNDSTIADAWQTVINNYVQSNPIGYKGAYIKTYNLLSSNQFNNYLQYNAVKETIKNSGGYGVFFGNNGWNTNWYLCLVTFPKDKFPINFYGTVNADGGFSSVQMEHNWATVNRYNQIALNDTTGIKYYHIFPSGTIEEITTIDNSFPNINQVVNSTTVSTSSNAPTIMTNLGTDEYIYVFETLNSLKNYNAGLPQPYYLGSDFGTHSFNFNISDFPSNGSSYYSSVINNVQSGWSAEEVLQLVDKVIKNGGSSSGSSTGSGSSGDSSSMWKNIGEAIASLISGIVTVVEKVAVALKDAILGLLNIFVGEDGLFSKLAELVNTNFSGFLSAIFGWLPPEIVTLFSATLVFGIFFAIWKMIRG